MLTQGSPPPPLTSLVYTNWYSDVSISVGAVGHNIVIVAPSNPC
jgi:splicing factor 3B subunit 3